MPELGIEGQMRKELNEASKGDRSSIYSKWKDVAEKHNREFVGSGAECFVIEDKEKDKLFAINYYDEGIKEAKMRFYNNKILKILFPYNFPRIYASFERGDDNLERIPGTVRERVYGVAGDKQNIFKRVARDLRTIGIIPSISSYNQNKNSGHTFNKVEKALREIGVDVGIDRANINLIIDKNGNEFYIDKVYSSIGLETNEQKFIDYMKKNNYSEREISAVVSVIKRMKTLDQEFSQSNVDMSNLID